jgi:adenine phosphoribosyltransferase
MGTRNSMPDIAPSQNEVDPSSEAELAGRRRGCGPERSNWAQDDRVDAALKSRLIASFRWLDPGPHSTHLVSDMSGWWRDPEVIAGIGPALADLFPGARPTVVAAPEVGGFLLGPLVAGALRVGFVEAYKDTRSRRIADAMVWARAAADYRGRTLGLGVRAARVGAGDRVLVVDDWADTGAQIGALAAALSEAGAEVVGAAVVVDARPAGAGEPPLIRGLLRPADLPA